MLDAPICKYRHIEVHILKKNGLQKKYWIDSLNKSCNV